MTFADAFANDAADQPLEAIRSYEELVGRSQADRTVFANLVVLYLNALDPGFAAAHHLPESLWTDAWPRLQALLEEAERRFPGDPEFKFWRLFAEERLEANAVHDEAYLELARQGFALAYLPLYARSRGQRYRPELQAVLDRTRPDSARGRFILSYAPLRTFPGGKDED